MTFQISALPAAPFAPLFSLSDGQLRARSAVRRVADRQPGFPCRVSLRDAAAGETVLLLNHEHHSVRSPFRSAYAIYVRKRAVEARPEPGEVPEMLRSRLLSVRAFDGGGMLLDADVVEGTALETLIERLLVPARSEYLHIHFARPGCFACRVAREQVRP